VTPAGPSPGARSDGHVRVRATVSGRVQGVWYRESCRRRAEELGVSGEVRNTAAGTVEIEAQGARAAVEALLGWAREGPPAARVTGLTVVDLPLGEDAGFRVR
jgi:acylphosphatase